MAVAVCKGSFPTSVLWPWWDLLGYGKGKEGKFYVGKGTGD